MYPFEYKVSFRVFHPTIDPDKISTQLLLEPEISHRLGDIRKTPKGTSLKGRYESTYWSYTIPQKDGISLIDFLADFTETLESHRDFLASLRTTGGRFEYFIGWFSGVNSGEEFDYTLLSKIANLQIDLSFDIYSTTPEEAKKLLDDVTTQILSAI